MTVANYTKTAAERKRYIIDYTDWLDVGETVTAMVFNTLPSSPPTTGQVLVDAFAIDASGLFVTYYVSGGNNGAVDVVEVLATTSGSQVKEDNIIFSVQDVPA